jgi:phenylpyruvate tautomerase PptA (4-oxalocrotonate tautomerase family)
MLEFLQNLLYAVIVAAVPVITGFVCKWLASLYENNKTRIKNENVQAVVGRVTDVIVAAVETTTGTYVKQLKADNLFDAEAQKEAFNKTFDAVKKQLTEETTNIIAETYGDIDAYLTNKIEQFVEELKK